MAAKLEKTMSLSQNRPSGELEHRATNTAG